jgi:hypothetical protein
VALAQFRLYHFEEEEDEDHLADLEEVAELSEEVLAGSTNPKP